MKKYNRIILSFCIFLLCPGLASATSLDELYRNIVRSDNQGYLPMFVKNRSIPDVLIEEEILRQIPENQESQPKKNIPHPIYISNDRDAQKAARLAAIKRWENALKAVEENRVTPLELEFINDYAAKNDPKAVEVLAWMNARGIGIKPNLVEAFNLYQKAAALKVPRAAENALLVYKSMNAEQRRLVTGFKK